MAGNYPQWQTPQVTDTTTPNAWVVGDVLSTTTGIWLNMPSTYAYQWQSGGVNINGATSSTYTLQASDVGNFVTVVVTASNVAGTASASAASVGPVVTAGGQVPTSPTFLGNSFAGLIKANGGQSYYQSQISMNVVSLYASPDATGVVCVSQYCEDNRSVRMLQNTTANGFPLGSNPGSPFVNSSAPAGHLQDNGPGTDVVMDASNVYVVGGQLLGKAARSNWTPQAGVQDPSMVFTTSTLLTGTGYGIAIIGSNLYVIDAMTVTGNPAPHRIGTQSPAGAALRTTTTALGALTTLATIPNARKVTPDRQGNLWIVSQGVIGTTPPKIWYYNTSGTQLGVWSLPTGVYPLSICADPSTNTIWIPDNGTDQNYKGYTYNVSGPTLNGVASGGTLSTSPDQTIGTVGGYMAGPTPGLLGPTRFICPKDISMDSSGNYYLLQSGAPNQNPAAWDVAQNNQLGATTFMSKLSSDKATEVWRVHSTSWGGDVGAPTKDWTKAYQTWLSYNNVNGTFLAPYACHVDFNNTNNHRFAWGAGATTFPWDANGRRYQIEWTANQITGGHGFRFGFYRLDGEIFNPILWFAGPAGGYISSGGANYQFITPGGTMTSISAAGLTDQELCIEPTTGDVWVMGDANQSSATPATTPIWQFVNQGFDVNGVPQYSSSHVNKYALPAGMAHGVRLVVYGSSIWISGYAGAAPTTNFDFSHQSGHLFMKATLSGGVFTPNWSHTVTYNDQTSGGFYTYACDIAASPNTGTAIIVWNRDATGGNPGYMQVIDDATGGVNSNVTYQPLVASTLGWAGSYDQVGNPNAIQVNDWMWAEDDWGCHTLGWQIP